MLGIGLLILISLWGWLAYRLSKLLVKKIFPTTLVFQDKWNNKLSLSGNIILVLVMVLIFFLPVIDEIISYSNYSKMCGVSSKYNFAPGMDAEKVSGRRYKINLHEERIQLFPFKKTLPENSQSSGVVVDVYTLNIIDATTDELLLVGRDVKPISSFLALQWDGGRIPWLLRPCYVNDEILHKLNLKRAID